MNSGFIRQTEDASLAQQVREHQDLEYAELRDAVQADSVEDRRAVAAGNHVGVGRIRWQPARARRA